MQRVLATAFTADARFVLSGSDDGNVRVWKANASEKLGIVTARERSAIEYRGALKEIWKMDAEIGKVQRYVPFFYVDYDLSLIPALPRGAHYLLNETHANDRLGVGTYQGLCIRLAS